jgi:Zn-dependent protease with chaperone function
MCNCKPQASTALTSAARFVDAVKALENLLLVLYWDSDAIVLYAQHRVAAFSAQGEPNRPALFRVLDRVVQQNIHDSPQRCLIPSDYHG